MSNEEVKEVQIDEEAVKNSLIEFCKQCVAEYEEEYGPIKEGEEW